MSSIKENRWDCTECGTNQGRNDMWHEGDVCGECVSKKLTTFEQGVIETLSIHEAFKIKKANGLDKISGGFCTIEFVSCNSNEVVLMVKSGVTDDAGSDVHLDQIILDRETLKIID